MVSRLPDKDPPWSEPQRPWLAMSPPPPIHSPLSLVSNTSTLYCVQAVSTFERLWNLARETSAPVWSPNEVFRSKNLVMKSLQKIWSENIQKRRPRGSSIKHGGIWPAKFGQIVPSTNLSTITSSICLNGEIDFFLHAEVEWLWKKII